MRFISEKLRPTLGFFEKKLTEFEQISIHLMDFKATEKTLNLPVRELEYKSCEDLLSSFENNLVELFSNESVLPEEFVLPEELNRFELMEFLDHQIFPNNELITFCRRSFKNSLRKIADVDHQSSYAPTLRRLD